MLIASLGRASGLAYRGHWGGVASAPVVTATSATGALPLLLQVSDSLSDEYTGKYVQWEFAGSLTPTKNADGSYVTTTQHDVTQIQGSDFSNLDIALGYNQPSGAFAFHMRFLTENPSGAVTVTDSLGNTFNADAGSWSNDYADTITVSSAAWSAGAKDKSANITLSGSPVLTATNVPGNNVFSGTRTTIPASAALVQAELTISSLIATGTSLNGDIFFGVCDAGSVQDLSASTVVPGSTLPGCGMKVRWDSATYTIQRNGGTQTGTLPGGTAAVVGDAIIWRLNTSGGSPVMEFWYYRAAGATITAIATVAGSNAITLSSQVPATFYACFSGWKANDGGTANFGASAFLKALDGGFTYYG